MRTALVRFFLEAGAFFCHGRLPDLSMTVKDDFVMSLYFKILFFKKSVTPKHVLKVKGYSE